MAIDLLKFNPYLPHTVITSIPYNTIKKPRMALEFSCIVAATSKIYDFHTLLMAHFIPCM